MSSQPIKSYITLRNIAQISRFEAASAEQICSAYQCTEGMAGAIERLIDWANEGRIAIIAGERGVGKSHLLAFLRALLEQPDLTKQIELPGARKRLEKFFRNKKLRVKNISLYCDFDKDTTSPAKLIDRCESEIVSATVAGITLAVLIDGLSPLLRQPDRDAYIKWLEKLVDRAKAKEYWLFLTLDQDLVDANPSVIDSWRKYSEVEIIPLTNLATIADQLICQKNATQRRNIQSLYEELRRQMPHFLWSEREFLECYPLHPQILKLVPALRKYARTFSLFGFFYDVAPRATLRRGLNLVCLIELFESFEFDLRRNPLLTDLFAAYDHLVENFVRSLPATQQLYGKMLLRGLTLLSLTERPYTTLEIADSVMLFDEIPPVLFRQSLKTVMDFMATAAGDRMEVSDEGEKTRFLLYLSSQQAVKDPVTAATQQIPDDDNRLIELLCDTARQSFKDWPLCFDSSTQTFKRRTEMELWWRGTARRGIIKFGDSLTSVGQESETKSWEWEIILISAFSKSQLPAATQSISTVCYWHPGELTPDDIKLLKRLLVLREEGKELLSPQELAQEQPFITSQVNKIFLRCYLEQGRVSLLPETTNHKLPKQEKKLTNLLGNLFDKPLKKRFPAHPCFNELLNAKTLKILARGLFYRSEWNRTEMKKYLEQFALPLHIVVREGEHFEYARRVDIPEESPFGKLLKLIEEADDQRLNRVQFETTMRAEPFGLQLPVMLLLVLGAAAAGHLILTNETDEVILTSVGIRSGCDVASYSHICSPQSIQRQAAATKPYTIARNATPEPAPQQPLEMIFQETVAEALNNEAATAPTENLSQQSEDVLVEYYQTGQYPQETINLGLTHSSAKSEITNSVKPKEHSQPLPPLPIISKPEVAKSNRAGSASEPKSANKKTPEPNIDLLQMELLKETAEVWIMTPDKIKEYEKELAEEEEHQTEEEPAVDDQSTTEPPTEEVSTDKIHKDTEESTSTALPRLLIDNVIPPRQSNNNDETPRCDPEAETVSPLVNDAELLSQLAANSELLSQPAAFDSTYSTPSEPDQF
ncbi:MAG: hypothetical protein AB1489_30210, partial [Acidobacteriota bacterium]